jgi:hypothetical protein
MATTIVEKPVVGVFESAIEAERVINTLRDLGFRDDQIGVTSREVHTLQEDAALEHEHAEETYAAEGAAAGVAGGAGLGLLWGLGAVAGVMPIIGPAIAAGTMAAVISSAAVGAAVGGLAGALIGMGIPDEEARFYEAEFHRGRYIVTVHPEGRDDVVRQVFQDHHATDYVNRGEVVRPL